MREGRNISLTPALSRGRRDVRPTKEAPAQAAPGDEPGGGPGHGVGVKLVDLLILAGLVVIVCLLDKIFGRRWP